MFNFAGNKCFLKEIILFFVGNSNFITTFIEEYKPLKEITP